MALLIENDPRDRGLAPDGDALLAGGRRRRSRVFRARGGQVAAIRGIVCRMPGCSFGLFVPFVHLIPFAIDHGVAQTSAVLLLGAIGVGSTGGRFVLGGVADRLGRAAQPGADVRGNGIGVVDLDFCERALGHGFVRAGLWRVLRRLRCHAAGPGDGLFRWSQCQRHHRHALHQRGLGTLVGPSAAGFAFDVSHSYTLPILMRRLRKHHRGADRADAAAKTASAA